MSETSGQPGDPPDRDAPLRPDSVSMGPQAAPNPGGLRPPVEATSRLSPLSGVARTFGKYRLLAELGRGGMADVHLAVTVGPAGFSKLQVIKRLRPGMTDEQEMRSMMLDEARLAARLNHKNIVQTNEVGIVDDQYFLAMEHLDGQPYHRILKRAAQLKRTIPLPFAVKILCEVLSGLHYAHEARDYDGTLLGVVHRDISPQNLFVTYDGQVKVVDFGIAKSTGRLVETQTGIIRGKITYMAPEQAFAAEVDRRADIFSVGVLLWEAIAGERLWGQMSDPEIVARMLRDIPKITSVRPDAPADLADLCDRALSREREKRPATAADMRSELEAYLAVHDIQVTAEALGALVVDLFADEREELHRLVDRELALLRAENDALERSDIPGPVRRITDPGMRRNIVPSTPPVPPVARIPGTPPVSPALQQAASRRAPTEAPKIPEPRPTPFPDSFTPTVPRAPSFDQDDTETMTEREFSPPVAVLSNAPGPPAPVTAPSAAPAEQAEPAVAAAAPAARSRGPLIYIAAGVSVLAAFGLFAMVGLSSRGPEPAATTAPTATTATAAPTAAPTMTATASPVITAAPQSNLVHLRITTNPVGAKVMIDGAPLPPETDPLDIKFVKDGAVHRINVEAPGFYPQVRMVVFDKDQSIEVILHNKKGAGH